jgi:hypothetical protein
MPNYVTGKHSCHSIMRDSISTVHERYADDLQSLLTLNFQQFEKAQSMAA